MARYRLGKLLRPGPGAEVFEAILEGEGGFVRRVALKKLTASAASDPETRAAFVDEARIAGLLHHSAIVAILDTGVIDDLPFHALELVDGKSLAALIRERAPFPIEIALFVAA